MHACFLNLYSFFCTPARLSVFSIYLLQYNEFAICTLFLSLSLSLFFFFALMLFILSLYPCFHPYYFNTKNYKNNLLTCGGNFIKIDYNHLNSSEISINTIYLPCFLPSFTIHHKSLYTIQRNSIRDNIYSMLLCS